MIRLNIINVMEEALRNAGDALLRDHGEIINLRTERSRQTFFRRTREFAKKRVVNSLDKAKPGLPFYEELAADQASDCWLINLFDGNQNLLRGSEYFSLGVALIEGGKIAAAVIYAPACNRLYWAQQGHGAYLENRRLRCIQSNLPEEDGVIAVHNNQQVQSWAASELTKMNVALRIPGALNLTIAGVAAGNYDALVCSASEKASAVLGCFIAREAKVRIEMLGDGQAACIASNDIVNLIVKLTKRSTTTESD